MGLKRFCFVLLPSFCALCVGFVWLIDASFFLGVEIYLCFVMLVPVI
jgi:hypothetical protein